MLSLLQWLSKRKYFLKWKWTHLHHYHILDSTCKNKPEQEFSWWVILGTETQSWHEIRNQAFAVLAHNFCGLEEIFSPNCVSAYKLLTHNSSVNALFDSLLKKYYKKVWMKDPINTNTTIWSLHELHEVLQTPWELLGCRKLFADQVKLPSFPQC